MEQAVGISQTKLHGLKKELREWKEKGKEWGKERQELERTIGELVEKVKCMEEWQVEGVRGVTEEQPEISSSLEWLKQNGHSLNYSSQRESDLRSEIARQSKLISKLETEKEALVDQNEQLRQVKGQSCSSSGANKVESLSTNSQKFMQSLEQKNNYIEALKSGLLSQPPSSSGHSSKPADESNSLCRHSSAKPR